MATAKQRSGELRIKDKTVLKTLGQCSFAQGGEIASVDVKDGKIVRIRPHHHDERYTEEELGQYSWRRTASRTRRRSKAFVAPYQLAYKKRVYSPNRIKYPLKRVDWDPKRPSGSRTRTGARASTCASAGTRRPPSSPTRSSAIHKEYGPLGILAHGDGHGETKTVHGVHGVMMDLLEHHRRLHPGGAQRRQLGGLVLGHQARLGQRGERPVPAGRQHDERRDPAHGHDRPHRGRPGDDAVGIRRAVPQRTSSTSGRSWARSRSSSLPTSTTRAPSTPTSGYPILPNTDAALHLAIAYTWMTEGTYDKEYVATHVVGFDKFEDYVLGREDGVPKTPEWASSKMRHPRVDDQGARPGMGRQPTTRHALLRRLVRPRPVLA